MYFVEIVYKDIILVTVLLMMQPTPPRINHNTQSIQCVLRKQDGMMHLESLSKSYRNHVQNVEHQLNVMVAVCIWYARDLVAHSNGVGCVKRNGPEIVWVPIGSVKITK